jgi:uncharacterized delta-60 repeat protein
MNSFPFSKHIAVFVLAAALASAPLLMAQAGTLDPTFGTGGIVTTPNTATFCGQVTSCSIAIQSDGKIVVAGGTTVSSNGSTEGALARYTTTGGLDTTFGTGGLVLQTLVDGGVFSGLAIQSDGKILTVAPDNDFKLAVFRYNPNGTPDTTFGTDGIAAVTISLVFTTGPLALLPDGRILATANNTLVRLLSSGQLDTSFGTGGLASIVNSGALGVLPGGKILMTSNSTFAVGGVARYNAGGSLDTTFGVVGQAPSFGPAAALAILSDGKIVVGNTLLSGPASTVGSASPQGFVLTRYNNNGTVDTTFGSRGAVVTSFPGEAYSVVFALGLQSSGYIVAAGVTEVANPAFGAQPSDFALARYTPSGQLDPTFGSGGLVSTAFGTSGSNLAAVSALAIQSDGNLVVVGYDDSSTAGPGNGFTLARYLGQ